MKISVIIPTKNRQNLLKKTLRNLSKNNFFFDEIIIIDSSDNPFSIKPKEFKKIKHKIKIYKSIPSISIQRNMGLRKVNLNSKYVMFLDDDVNFKENAFKEMHKFLFKNKGYAGIGFNLIINKKSFLDKIKRSKFFQILKIYDNRSGIVTKSGWHTKAINLKKDTQVQWLPTQAVIYNKKKLKNINLKKNLVNIVILKT